MENYSTEVGHPRYVDWETRYRWHINALRQEFLLFMRKNKEVPDTELLRIAGHQTPMNAAINRLKDEGLLEHCRMESYPWHPGYRFMWRLSRKGKQVADTLARWPVQWPKPW